jgi:fucose 4-O-acetylase-like acetyltransferase
VFAVPAFLFISGFFAAYAGRGCQSAWNWRILWVRIRRLLVPYLLWSVVIFVGDACLGEVLPPAEYLWKLLTWGARGPYFFVPLLCCLYLVSPLMESIAKNSIRWLVPSCGLLTLGSVGARYLQYTGVVAAGAQLVTRLTPPWSIPIWSVYFAMGITSGHCGRRIWRPLTEHKWALATCAVLLFSLNVIEGDANVRAVRGFMAASESISYHLCAMACIFVFLAFDGRVVPAPRVLGRLGKHSYAVYLLHFDAMRIPARLIYHLVPSLLSYLSVFVPLMFALGLGLPLTFRLIVDRSPARRIHSYLLG